jgi:predicted TIM-barrel fold metal-dependent hydrolase
MIPIFDSLTHPTLTGNWFESKKDASFSSLKKGIDTAEFIGACVVGLNGVEGYSHEAFIDACSVSDKFIPIAGVSPISKNIEKQIELIKKVGFKGVKLHPRFGAFDLTNQKQELIKVFEECSKHNLVVMLCTYMSCSIEVFPTKDPYWELVDIISKAPNTKVILMHGGTTRILQYADLARFNKNILLDLSYTMMKYKGSSLDLDMKYLFKTFDQKICIGSDHPEFTLKELRVRAEELAEGIETVRKENIFNKNLTSFFN